MTEFLMSLGPYSAAVFIILQALQVVVAPVPGELTGLVGGYIYGKTFGFILSTAGLSLGSWVAFELANLFGKPFVERIIKKEVLEKFKFLETNTGATICFLLFVIPGFPKDVLCYVVGLSGMRLVTFLIVTTIGRVPGTYLLTIQGAAVGNRAYSEAVLIAFICASLLLAVYLCRGHIFRWVKARRCFLFAVGIGILGYTPANGQVVARFFYDENGNVVRQERDTNGDRRVDVLPTHKDGNKVLQEEDQNFNGKIDARYFFRDGQFIGQERVTEAEPLIPAGPFSSRKRLVFECSRGPQ